MTLEPMTDEERDFAAQYHDLVYKFLRAHRLPEDEYYDVVIFGYLEAVQRNFRVAVEPEKRNFSALAKLCMGSAVRHELQSRWLLIRVANTTAASMDAPLLDDESLSFHDIVPDKTRYVMEEVENRDLIRRALDAASERELEVLALGCSGFSPAEISQILNISIHTTHRASCDLHLKTRPIKDGNPPGKTAAQNYYQSHKAELNKKNEAYRLAHRDEINAKRRAYRVSHKDEINAAKRAYARKEDKERRREYNRCYWQTHAEEILAKRRAQRAAKKAASNAPNIESGSVL